MTDDPIALVQDTPARRRELAAMRAYRAKYAAGPAWLDLAVETRCIWIGATEALDQFDAAPSNGPMAPCFYP